MLYAYEQNFAGVSYKGFRYVDRQIAHLYKELHSVNQKVDNLTSFLCHIAGIDAELIVLYLNEDERQRALKALSDCKTIC